MNTSFTIAHGCMLVVSLLPIVCAGIAKWGAFGKPRQSGGYDNDNPRAWLASQAQWRARANSAQANSFEALPFFLGAVIVAQQLAVPQARLDLLALAFVALRLAYIISYLAARSSARSIIWVAGFGVNIAIMLSGWR
jgi:uncharacterized MAPEG superfamily protein